MKIIAGKVVQYENFANLLFGLSRVHGCEGCEGGVFLQDVRECRGVYAL